MCEPLSWQRIFVVVATASCKLLCAVVVDAAMLRCCDVAAAWTDVTRFNFPFQ